jgi:hypothetical protein
MVKGIGSLGQSGGVRRTSKNNECGGNRELRHNGSETEANIPLKAPERTLGRFGVHRPPETSLPRGMHGIKVPRGYKPPDSNT